MKQWQYHTETWTLKELQEPEYLDSLGELGWELVCLDRLTGAERTTTKWVAVFKKELVQVNKP